jgi:RHS repeat-associated protein
MKTLHFIFLGLLAVTLAAHAQDDTDPGRIQPNNTIPILTPDTNIISQGQAQFQPANNSPGSPGYAEAITPDIQALAAGLQNDPVKIFNYVHDHIRFVLYYGSMKGAELTLLEQSGNDFDQCSLLVALLSAAGYSPGYGFGMLQMPYQATDGTANDLQHWLQLNLTSNNWSSVNGYLNQLVANRGYYIYFDMGDNNHVAFQRVWVTLPIGGTTYLLDPAFKVSQPVAALSGFSLTNAFGSGTISNDLLTAASGTDTGNYAKSLSESAVRGKLTAYTTNLLNYLQNNFPNASVQDIMGGSQIVSSTNTALSQSLLFSTFTDNNAYPLQTWGSVPTNFMSTFSVNFASTNQTWFFPQLQGQGVSLSFDGGGTAKLWLGGSVAMQGTNTGSGLSTTVTLTAKHPFGGWDSVNNVPTDSGWADQSASRPYQRTNANYAVMYGFEPSLKWLNAQEQQLDIYRQQGYSNTSPQVVNATLNVMGMNWLAQTELAQELLCQQAGQLSEYHHRIGRMSQEIGHGYYVDVYMQQDESFPATGIGTADYQNESLVFDVSSYIWSALEHGTIEQMQNTNLVGASTVKMLEVANTNGQAVYLATSTNWSTIQGSLTNYGSLMSTFASLTSQGYYLLLPQNGANLVAGTGSWQGDGYVELYATSTQRLMGMIIGGGYNGGYVSDPTAVVNVDYTELSVVNQPTYFDTTPVYTPAPSTADPVDTANGTFQVENTDLSIGQSEPHGITLSRYYNGTRRFSNPAGMASGWIHNYCATANSVAAPQAGLGGTTPAQMAAMLVTTYATLNLYNNTQPDPKNWLTTALIAKWGVDQLTKNGVSVSLGKDSVQFVKQPNGVFTPPANCTMTLLQTNSSYWLQMRHGNTFKFNAAGFLTNIVDQYSQPLTVSYNASNWVSSVKDWKNRTFTFTYSGTPSRLASVSDGTRTVSYGYATTYNSKGDLTSFTDAEGKTSTYQYDTNHQITATLDAQSRLVVSNVYDGDGHVATQYTQGDPNKAWQIFWSGWQTISQDPAGGRQTYFYDAQSRLIGQQDALGNLTQTFYDGQNHIVETISPLNEVNQFVFDGNNNLAQKIDPLGFTNQFVYDNQNNLVKAIDPRGNVSTFGYNTNFSLIGQTNGAGDFVNYSYTASGALAGTLATKTDSGGTTTYGYDSTYGQLISIAYPSGLGTNTYANSSFGDVTSRTDGRGFITTFSYNNRRQLTNSVAPTNLVTKIAFDAVGNMASTTDRRGNVTSNSWSATRHLLATALPSTSQGTPIVTNAYDSRDWLIRSTDPLQNTTLYTNDAAGHLVVTTDPLSRTTAFGYDPDGHRTAITNGATEITRQTWDARGTLIQLIDGAGHTSSRAYDGAGNQIILTNRNGKTWQFQFDGANRLTKTITPLGNSTTLTFNHQGLLASLKDAKNQTATNSYDGKGRLTSRADSIGATAYGYDANNNPTSISENGNTNTWTYDAYNHVSSYKDVYGNLIQYKYDASGNLTNLVYPGGKNVYYTYDSNNRVTSVVDWSGRRTTMTYDLAERLIGITRPNGTYRTIGYDAAGEATNILEQNALGFPIALLRQNWDAAARMQWEFSAPLHNTNSMPTRTMTYDDDNELYTFNGNSVSVDADGNLTLGPLTNSTFGSYTYDARNRLLNAGGVTNAYDAMNNRVGQTFGTNTSIFVVNPNVKLPQVLMRIKNGVTNYYIYGAGLLYQITQTATATNTRSYHYDSRGSTIALTDDNGNVTDRIEYSAYGSTTYRAGNTDTPFLFNGRYGVMTDPNGLLYMRNRFYSPYLCRFVNPDPTGFSSGMNFFAYANGNPVSYLDPSGLGAIGENQNLSWLNTPTTTDGTLFGNNYNLSSSTGTSSLFDTTSTALNIAGIAQFGAEYGSGSAVLGLYTDAATSSGLYFNSSFWGGNQYVNTMQISDIAHGAGYVLFGATVINDVYGAATQQISPLAAEGDVSAGYIGLVGGPVGAAVGVTYGLFHNDINGAAAGSFQILTDWYYNAPFGPNFADLPNNP